MIWELDGVSVGHWTDPVAQTGCTVVLFNPAVVASAEVRGGAPASHELALLEPTATVQTIDAVVLSGGSAFGLAAAIGVTEWCEDAGRGLPTPGGRVPIVVGMSLFDLLVGDRSVRPGVEQGREAAAAAGAAQSGRSAPSGTSVAGSVVTGSVVTGSVDLGRIGAGTGATISKWRGLDQIAPGGLVGALHRDGDLIVAALIAVNPWGDVHGAAHDGAAWPELPAPGATGLDPEPADGPERPDESGTRSLGAAGSSNTTIGVVVTNAALDKLGCHHVARGAHDGLARAITPPHSHVDGDAFVAAATGQVPAAVELVRAHAVEVVDEAIRSVARHADAAPGDVVRAQHSGSDRHGARSWDPAERR